MDRDVTRSSLSKTARAIRRMAAALLLAGPVTLLAGAPSNAQSDAQFQSFVAGLWPHAKARGVGRDTFERAFAGVTPDPEVLELSRKQPEFKTPIWEYMAKRVSEARITNGRAKAEEWAALLESIERFYGVDRYTVVSIWGMETNYGGFLGGHSVVRALATLACCSHRTAYFRAELLNALDVLQQGHVAPENMVGSWAGAMGHTQFMPSSFKRFAADGNADGRRDIWMTIPDALASTANYLKENGWRAGETWGYEVTLREGFDLGRVAKAKMKVSDWERLGVRRANGAAFPRPDDVAHIVAPLGRAGPVFLALRNFSVIKRYNNSDAYALAVGHLADRIRGGGPFTASWPFDGALTERDAAELQALLAMRGYDAGEPDGKIGSKTRQAIRAFQSAQGLMTDGAPSLQLLHTLRAKR